MRRMALLYPHATLEPTKLELLATWLPTRDWYRGPDASALKRVASYRFDDPDGEVGIETLLVRAGNATAGSAASDAAPRPSHGDGPLYQVPLTYRGAPLDGAEEWLVGTTAHSVLGPRWVYDGCRDPLSVGVLAAAIVTGAPGAEETLHVDGREEPRALTTHVRGSGVDGLDPSDATTHLVVARVVGDAAPPDARGLLTGTWPGQPDPVALAWIRP
jgi:hypothetical protein